MRITLSTAIVSTVLLFTGACSSSEVPEPKVIEGETGALLLVSSVGQEQGMEAQITGTLKKGDGGCLYIGGESYQDLVFWPAGTVFNDDESAVLMPSYQPLVIGSEITIAGGGTATDAPGSPVVPSACDSSSVVAVN